MSKSVSLFVLIALSVLLLSGVILMFMSVSITDYRSEVSDEKIIVRKPLTQRWSHGLMMVMPLFLPLLFYPKVWNLQAILWEAWMMILSCGAVLAVGSLVGPEDLWVDLRRQTFRARYGFWLRPTDRVGLLSDLEAVEVRQYHGRGQYYVFILLGPTKRVKIKLAEFSFRSEARAVGEATAKSLGIPLI